MYFEFSWLEQVHFELFADDDECSYSEQARSLWIRILTVANK